MFNFLENAELLKERNKQRKTQYRKELQLQIEQNKLKKLEEKNILDNKKSKIVDVSQTPNINNKLLLKQNNKFIKKLQTLKNSIDNSIIKTDINKKLKSLQFNSSNIKNYNNLRIITDCNNNELKKKNCLIDFKSNSNSLGKNYFLNQSKEHKMKKSFSQMIKSISLKHNNIKSKINYHNENLMEEINIQFLFNGFVEQQIRTINDYATNLENIFFLQYTKNDKDIILFNYLIKNEKNKALQSIKNEKNKLKNKFGFFPLEIIYDSRIEQLFNKILNKIISIYSSFNQIQINNYINQENSSINSFPFKPKFLDDKTEYNFSKINNLETDININPNLLQKLTTKNSVINISDKINIEEDLKFFEFWINKFENEIMKEKNKIYDVNETIYFDNIKQKLNNSKENILNILPANNFFKNVKLKEFNRMDKNKKGNNEFKLPEINLKKPIFKKRNYSANNKISENIFSFI